MQTQRRTRWRWDAAARGRCGQMREWGRRQPRGSQSGGASTVKARTPTSRRCEFRPVGSSRISVGMSAEQVRGGGGAERPRALPFRARGSSALCVQQWCSYASVLPCESAQCLRHAEHMDFASGDGVAHRPPKDIPFSHLVYSSPCLLRRQGNGPATSECSAEPRQREKKERWPSIWYVLPAMVTSALHVARMTLQRREACLPPSLIYTPPPALGALAGASSAHPPRHDSESPPTAAAAASPSHPTASTVAATPLCHA